MTEWLSPSLSLSIKLRQTKFSSVQFSRSVVSDSLWSHGLYSPWSSPGQSTGVSSLSLLQGIFPTQGSNPGFPHCRWILYQLSHKGSPRILYWVAYPFSSGFSWHRNRTRVSCIAGRFFTNWNIREALKWDSVLYNECLSVISNIIHISNWVLEPHSKKQLIFSIFRISLSQAAFQGRNKHWLVPVPSNYYNGI